mgnify:CR=1 FL=1
MLNEYIHLQFIECSYKNLDMAFVGKWMNGYDWADWFLNWPKNTTLLDPVPASDGITDPLGVLNKPVNCVRFICIKS